MRLGHHGLGDDVLGGLVERGGEPQHLVAASSPRRCAPTTMRAWPTVSVPVLSITSERTCASVSIALPPLIRMPRLAARDSPATSATGTARISGQGVATTSTATARTGSPVSPQAAPASATVTARNRQRVAVGQPRHRRARMLRRLHQPDDAGIGALVGAVRGQHVEGVADIGRAAEHGVAGLEPDRQRLAGERRLIEHRHALGHRAVHRHHIAAAHQQPVAGHDELERDLVERAVAMAHRRARHARQAARSFRGARAARQRLRDTGRRHTSARRWPRRGPRRPRAPPSSTAPRRCRARPRRAGGW